MTITSIRANARLIVFAAAFITLPLAAAAEELSRLFFTPEERAALGRQRDNREDARPAEGAALSVSGVVRRGDGRTTTWVNGVPQEENDPAAGVRVQVNRADPARTTVIAGREVPASLKVGETLDRGTGDVATGIGEGRIQIGREAPRRTR